MPLVLADRVRDTTTTTGTGTVTLSGTAPTGYQNFSVIGNGNTTYYTINAGSQWEVGIGTYSSTGPTLARTTVLKSSNANALVDFAAGVKDVFVTYPADEVVIQDGSTIQAGTSVLAVANGGTGVTTSTGTGSVVLSTSPTLTTPNLGTPSAGTVTNLTGTASININGTVGATTPNTGAFTSVTSTSAAGILTRAAATQDGIELIGRAGGTTSLKVTLTPTTLTASRTVTFPDANINFATGLPVANGGTGSTTAAGARTNLGATTVGGNFFTLANPTAIRFPRINADNTVSALDAATFRTAIGAGTVTSVAFSTGTTGLSVTGSPITASGTITLAGTLAVANGGTGVTTSTGTGSVVRSTSPTLTTPTLGAASATSIANALGAAGTPSYTFTGDLNTGIYSPAADTIAFSEGGVEAMRITSSGDVGVGTSAPSTKLTVAGTIRSTISSGTLDVSHDGTNGSLASSSQLLLYANGANNMIFHTNGSQRFTISSTGAITSSDLADAVGYKGIPQNAQTAAYTLALSDIGKHISITTGGVVIPANGTVAFPVGSAVTIYNNSASNQTISITTDTLRLAGTATTGSRTLAQRGICTCVKVAATEWVISGAGLT